MVIADTADVPLTVVDAPDEAAAQALVDAAAAEPFDLADGPLLRALLIRLAAEEHVLFARPSTTSSATAGRWTCCCVT